MKKLPPLIALTILLAILIQPMLEVDLHKLQATSIKIVCASTEIRDPHHPSKEEIENPSPLLLQYGRYDNPGKIVAIVKVDLAKPTRHELNPRAHFRDQNFNYGIIPDLKDMTKVQADALWGTGKEIKKKDGCETTYLLGYPSYPVTKKERVVVQPVFLDITFKCNKIDKYRLRLSNLNTDWIAIREEGGWQSFATLLPICVISAALLLRLRY